MLFVVSVTGEDPNEAALLANSIADAFNKFRLERQRQLMIRGIHILTEKYEDEEKEIPTVQTNVEWLRVEYKITNDIPPPELLQKQTHQSKNHIALPRQPYWEEKLKLDGMTEFHKLLKAKIESEKAELDHPKFSMVEINKAAVPPQTPVGPNRLLGALLCVIGLFPSVGGFFLLKSSRRQST
jgi:hypothetical protein